MIRSGDRTVAGAFRNRAEDWKNAVGFTTFCPWVGIPPPCRSIGVMELAGNLEVIYGTQ